MKISRGPWWKWQLWGWIFPWHYFLSRDGLSGGVSLTTISKTDNHTTTRRTMMAFRAKTLRQLHLYMRSHCWNDPGLGQQLWRTFRWLLPEVITGGSTAKRRKKASLLDIDELDIDKLDGMIVDRKVEESKHLSKHRHQEQLEEVTGGSTAIFLFPIFKRSVGIVVGWVRNKTWLQNKIWHTMIPFHRRGGSFVHTRTLYLIQQQTFVVTNKSSTLIFFHQTIGRRRGILLHLLSSTLSRRQRRWQLTQIEMNGTKRRSKFRVLPIPLDGRLQNRELVEWFHTDHATWPSIHAFLFGGALAN